MSSKQAERDAEGSDDVYIVAQLLDQRWLASTGKRPARRQYLVRWEGFSEAHDSWEDESNILDDELIDKFNAVEAKRNAMQAKRAARLDAASNAEPMAPVPLPAGSAAPLPPGVELPEPPTEDSSSSSLAAPEEEQPRRRHVQNAHTHHWTRHHSTA